MLIVYFEDELQGFLKRIPLYFLNAWLDRYPKLKLTYFSQNAKISQLQQLIQLKLLGEYRRTPLAIQKINIWSSVYLKKYLALYRPIWNLRKKIEKLTCKFFTFGNRSERVQTPKNFFYFFLVQNSVAVILSLFLKNKTKWGLKLKYFQFLYGKAPWLMIYVF